MKDLWIDIGATSREEAETVVKIGSPVTLQAEFARLMGNRAVARAFDNKAGLFIGGEVVRRLREEGGLHPDVGLYALGTVQEEIGLRRAQTTAAFNLQPHTALAIDMGLPWTTHVPDPKIRVVWIWERGPGISQGPSTNPVVFDLLKAAADEDGIPDQLQAYGDKSPTDARLIQTNRGGVATGLLSVPLRYRHTPSEVICIDDVEATIRLVCEYCRRVRPDT